MPRLGVLDEEASQLQDGASQREEVILDELETASVAGPPDAMWGLRLPGILLATLI